MGWGVVVVVGGGGQEGGQVEREKGGWEGWGQENRSNVELIGGGGLKGGWEFA